MLIDFGWCGSVDCYELVGYGGDEFFKLWCCGVVVYFGCYLCGFGMVCCMCWWLYIDGGGVWNNLKINILCFFLFGLISFWKLSCRWCSCVVKWGDVWLRLWWLCVYRKIGDIGCMVSLCCWVIIYIVCMVDLLCVKLVSVVLLM